MRGVILLGLCCIVCNILGATSQEISATFDFPSGTTVAESAGRLEVCVMLSQTPVNNIDIIVNAGPVPTTQEGVNFLDPNRMLSFTSTGPTRQCFNVVILQDNVVVLNTQLFQLSMSSTDQVALDDDEFIFITDSDMILVTFSQPSYTSTYENGPIMICAVIVSGEIGDGTTQPLQVSVTLEQSTATAGTDFVATVPSFSFQSDSGNESCVPVSILNDTNVENTETFTAVMTSLAPNSLMIVNGTATIVITDNNAATVSLQQTGIMINEGNRSTANPIVEVCVVLTDVGAGLERPVIVEVTTMELTASGDQDFIPIRTNLTFPVGVLQGSTRCADITIIGDDRIEENETFRAVISVQPPDVADQSEATITIIHDGDLNLCPVLANISNGQVVPNGYAEGSMATYTCNDNYLLSNGASQRTCQSNGAWSGNEPTCAALCSPLTVVNGVVSAPGSSPYPEGTVATYVCDNGYEFTGGDVTRTCQADRLWSGMEGTCTVVDCGSLADPLNGVVVHDSTTFSSIATYTCNAGFRLVNGNAIRTCTQEGQWGGSDPTCSGAPKVVVSVSLLLIAVLTALIGKL